MHVGTPEQVTAALAADGVVAQASDLIVHLRSTEPGQDATMEALE
ncbi:hypothetical protein ACQEVB_37115 [Pseudonocardia sp. CA-107938]